MALMSPSLISKEAKARDPESLVAPFWEAVEKLEKST
jgi:hypothetical protein